MEYEYKFGKLNRITPKCSGVMNLFDNLAYIREYLLNWEIGHMDVTNSHLTFIDEVRILCSSTGRESQSLAQHVEQHVLP